MISFMNRIRQIFRERKQLTLNDLYETLSKNSQFELSEGLIRHRIRSCVYALKKNEEIIRVGDSTYKKVN